MFGQASENGCKTCPRKIAKNLEIQYENGFDFFDFFHLRPWVKNVNFWCPLWTSILLLAFSEWIRRCFLPFACVKKRRPAMGRLAFLGG